MKTFCVGLSKTGTNSLCDALKVLLGLNVIHYASSDWREQIKTADGMADLPCVRYYKELDKMYPGSKFIWTIRDKESWLESIEKHWRRRPPSTLGAWGKENRMAIYGDMYFDRESMSKKYDEHMHDVEEYFSDRNDLHKIDIIGGDGWERLMKIMEVDLVMDTPTTLFPRSNTAPSKLANVDLVYPYVKDSNWDCLQYSIRSMEENFLDLRNIWIIGDTPEWANDKLNIVSVNSYHRGNWPSDFSRNRDYCHKILTAALTSQISNLFLCASDDHYLLSPRKAEDFFDHQMIREDLNVPAQHRDITNDWRVALWATYQKIILEGWAGMSYETHTPKLIEKEKLVRTFAHFGYGDGKLIWHTAYFNMFPMPGQGHWSEISEMKVGAYKPEDINDMDKFRQSVKDGVFLNHNDTGLSEEVKEVIRERFPTPSSYEKN